MDFSHFLTNRRKHWKSEFCITLELQKEKCQHSLFVHSHHGVYRHMQGVL